MVKTNYPGPDAMFRQRLRTTYADLSTQVDRCRPMGPEERLLTKLAEQVGEAYRALYGEEIRADGRSASVPPR